MPLDIEKDEQIQAFYAALQANGVDKSLVRIEDTSTDCVFFLNQNYYWYETGFRERGILFESKRFRTLAGALSYLFKIVTGSDLTEAKGRLDPGDTEKR